MGDVSQRIVEGFDVIKYILIKLISYIKCLSILRV